MEQTVLENEELIEARKKIMLAVTHDLRAPLASISSYAELLSTEREVSKCREYNRNIRQVAGHMSSMLNSLLGFSGWKVAGKRPFLSRSGYVPSPRFWKRILCRWRQEKPFAERAECRRCGCYRR